MTVPVCLLCLLMVIQHVSTLQCLWIKIFAFLFVLFFYYLPPHIHKNWPLIVCYQEAYYNLGRAMHQLNLLPAALFYYKKALELGPSIPQEGEEGDNIFDLRREIAYNISIIYRSSDSHDLARFYIEKYIVLWFRGSFPRLTGCDWKIISFFFSSSFKFFPGFAVVTFPVPVQCLEVRDPIKVMSRRCAYRMKNGDSTSGYR